MYRSLSESSERSSACEDTLDLVDVQALYTMVRSRYSEVAILYDIDAMEMLESAEISDLWLKLVPFGYPRSIRFF
jgi:hypothetical protein